MTEYFPKTKFKTLCGVQIVLRRDNCNLTTCSWLTTHDPSNKASNYRRFTLHRDRDGEILIFIEIETLIMTLINNLKSPND